MPYPRTVPPTFALIFGLLALLLIASFAGAEDAIPLPADLFSGAELIAVDTTSTPDGLTLLVTYANPEDTARVAVRIQTVDESLLQWGRLTTAESVNNDALGIVPAWKVPDGFDREAFIAATGCSDVRLVGTDTPRADVETNELGYFTGYALPAADHLITGELTLCLTEAGGHPGGVIVQVANFGPTGGDSLAESATLVGAVVDWLGEPDAVGTPPACALDQDDGFRVQVIEEECQDS